MKPRRPHYPRRSGRYLLCEEGQLYPLRSRARIKAVAIINLRMIEPERAACQPALPPSIPQRRPAKIDLNTIPSSMEMLADSWRKQNG